MGSSRYGSNASLLLLVMFSVLLLVSRCSSTKVQIQNDIDVYEATLDMHCSSHDDDLGQRSLHQGDEWHWEFATDLFSTYFYCDFRWYDNTQYHWNNGTFAVYEYEVFRQKFFAFCEGYCQWSARRDGFYLYRRDRNEWQKRGEWHVE
ncbi:hypothetical protein MKX01_029627 [Papaver californicum]|nr:hypothetical protein MKX01_029627 [Papaver californicum]